MLSGERARVSWDRRVRIGGIETFRVGRSGNALVAEWPGLASFTCGMDGAKARLVARPQADPKHVEKLRGGAVRALLHDLGGHLGLHASAVELGGRAALFLGPSGTGKSTAAAELCLLHGARLLADDVALLQIHHSDVHVLATEREHYLTGRSCRLLGLDVRPVQRTAKVAVGATRSGAPSCPLEIVMILRFDDRRRKVSVRALGGVDTARALLPAVHRFDLQADRSRELDQILTLYKRCRVVEVARCRSRSARSSVGPFLLDAMRGAQS